MSTPRVYLASGSPRRRELLRQIGVPHQLLEVGIDESVRPGENPSAYVSRLAIAKAEAGLDLLRRNHPVREHPEHDSTPPFVLGADTTVVLDDRIFGKPGTRGEALAMLRQLSGRTHRVSTAVALAALGETALRISHSEVTFRALREDECAAYWETGEPRDKAGAYAIQGLAAVFVSSLRGSYSGVMGLPLFETAELLDAAGAPRWQSA
jgi:septum formation protein